MRFAPSADQPVGIRVLAGGLLAALFLAASLVFTIAPADAGGQTKPSGTGPSCTCPQEEHKREELWPRPKYADTLRPEPAATLDVRDEIATLEAIGLALTELGDGQTYVWHRPHGRLSGVFQPTSSFKDSSGRVCRHIVMLLASGSYSRKTEGIACRLASGRWQLEG